MHIWLRSFTLGLLCFLIVFSIGCARKYAVLISTNEVTLDNVSYHSEWWYDLFLQYRMLKDNGFKDDKIYILYGSGNDFNTVHANYNATSVFGHAITDMAVNKANIQSVFNTLGSKVKTRDHFYVWWMGHGNGSGPGSCDLSMQISNTGETVTDAELKTYMSNVPNYRKRTVDVMTCHSGGMIDNMATAGTKTVSLTSSTCPESSYSISTTCNSRPHAEFHYTVPNALREQDPCATAVGSDYDSNGYVSLSEVHQYNSATMLTSTPQLGDPDNLASTTYIKKKEP